MEYFLQNIQKELIIFIHQSVFSENPNGVSVIAHLFSVLFIYFLILPLHEYAHGFVAYKLGDNTALKQGRLTLNPFSHFGMLSLACMFFLGIGWGKPVPFDSKNFKNKKRDPALTAAAGPVANILAAFIGGLIFKIIFSVVRDPISLNFLSTFLKSYIALNVSIAVLNFIPVPTLDGFAIFSAFLSNDAIKTIKRNEALLNLVFFFFIYVGFLNKPLERATNIILMFINFVTSAIVKI